MRRFGKALLTLLMILGIGFGLCFAYLAYVREQLPYNESGVYFDGMITWHQQSVTTYTVVAIGCFLVAMLAAFFRLR
jgi:hypothetical protein